MANTISEYKALARDIPRALARLEKDPEIGREANYYLQNIGKIKSIDQFLSDQRIYTFAMTAFGMKDMIYAKAMIRKVLTEGVDTPSSFAMSLTDQRFREFAQTFNFKTYGASTTAFDRTQQGTVDRFLRSALEEKAGKSSEALRLALYFERKAPNISTEYSILADKALYAVVRTALGLPDSIASADIDKQAKLLATRVKVSDFADAGKRDTFITRFLSMSTANSGMASASPALSLFSAGGTRIDTDTLMSLQTLRKFGN